MPTGLEFVPWETILAEMRTRFPSFLIVIEHTPEGAKRSGIRMEFHDSRSGVLHGVYGMANYATLMLGEHFKKTATEITAPGLDPLPPTKPL